MRLGMALDILLFPNDARIRFWERVNYLEGKNACWEWKGRPVRDGYGQYTWRDERGILKRAATHRVALCLTGTPVPADLYVLHSCDNPRCVRPGHLRLGTQFDNMQEAHAKGRLRIPPRKTHCIRGHSLTEGDHIYRWTDGRRYCLLCQKIARKERAERQQRTA